MAGAAGGCMLVRRAGPLDRIGGLNAHSRSVDRRLRFGRRDSSPAAISDSTFAENKSQHARAYEGWGDIWRMIARSAYTELRLLAASASGSDSRDDAGFSDARRYWRWVGSGWLTAWLSGMAWVGMGHHLHPVPCRYHRVIACVDACPCR